MSQAILFIKQGSGDGGGGGGGSSSSSILLCCTFISYFPCKLHGYVTSGDFSLHAIFSACISIIII